MKSNSEGLMIDGIVSYIDRDNIDTDQDNKNKDYRNFSMVSEKSRESINHGEYVRNGFKGNGRGFGDK